MNNTEKEEELEDRVELRHRENKQVFDVRFEKEDYVVTVWLNEYSDKWIDWTVEHAEGNDVDPGVEDMILNLIEKTGL